MSNENKAVRIVSAALDEDPSKSIVLRGVISPESYEFLHVAGYQREVLSASRQFQGLQHALANGGGVPDVYLGMRGGNYSERDSAFSLHDPVYIVDGLQRTSAARAVWEGGGRPRLGATIFFNTSEQWERQKFEALNMTAQRLSPNVLLRNKAEGDSQAMGLLLSLTRDQSFVLGQKVSWHQNMLRGELITAKVFAVASVILHKRFGGMPAMSVTDTAAALDRAYNIIGRGVLRENLRSFWSVLDECFGVSRITFRCTATCIKGAFLFSIAHVFADHSTFWRDARIFVEADLRRKIASFPLNDPEVMRLAAAGGAAGRILYQLIINHINSGKRTKHLEPFAPKSRGAHA